MPRHIPRIDLSLVPGLPSSESKPRSQFTAGHSNDPSRKLLQRTRWMDLMYWDGRRACFSTALANPA